MTDTCKSCDTRFENVERNEDGAPEIPGQFCAGETCRTFLCAGGCTEHLSFVCFSCGERFCNEHLVQFEDRKWCTGCAAEARIQAEEEAGEESHG